MNDSLVSVVITSYNQAEYLKKAFDSIIAQSYKSIECIIVDCGSNDNSHEIIEQYCAFDKRFTSYNIGKNGPSFARNFGMKKTKGEFIQLLDGDDWIENDKLASQVRFLKKNSRIDLVYSEIKYFSNSLVINASSR